MLDMMVLGSSLTPLHDIMMAMHICLGVFYLTVKSEQSVANCPFNPVHILSLMRSDLCYRAITIFSCEGVTSSTLSRPSGLALQAQESPKVNLWPLANGNVLL